MIGGAAGGAAALVLAFGAAAARADVVWLCKPGAADNPCQIGLDTTVRESDTADRVQTPAADPREIDCFYIYPTASNQLTPNADKSRDPELKSITQWQAARFSQHCRVYAPVYRQATLVSLVTGTLSLPGGDRQLGYGDVLEAWREYLAKDNAGRGVVLIGHSQGAVMLRQLLRREIESHRDQLRRLVGAVLLGGNVTVPAGKLVGGDFRQTPLCTRRAQVGCVVAYSSFAGDPPHNTRFGTSLPPPANNPSTLPGGPGYAIACTDPRPLAGSSGPLRILTPSRPFAPGLLAAGIVVTFAGMPPSAPTTWVIAADRYDGTCSTVNGATVLRYDPIGASRRPLFFPEPTWGTHLIDVNVELEPLISLVAQQAERWVRPDVRLTRRCGRRGRLHVALIGRDREFVSAVAFKLGRRVAARSDPDHLARVLSRRTIRGGRGTSLRAVIELRYGSAQRMVLRRSLPACGTR
jgi:hypothetical protein